MEDGLHGEGIPLAPRPAELVIKQEDEHVQIHRRLGEDGTVLDRQ